MPTQPPQKASRRTVLGLPFFVVVLVGVAGLLAFSIALTTVNGDDDEVGNTESPSGNTGAAGDPAVFGPIAVDGTALAPYSDAGEDPAVGQPAPLVEGVDLEGGSVAIGPRPAGPSGQPTVVAFLAHWCPHCQAELPRLVAAQRDGTFEGVRLVAVLTGSNKDAPNFPPGAWLEREGWSGDVLLDDEKSSAAAAVGLSSYPFLVWLDADGTVAARTGGEVTPDRLRELAGALDRSQSS